MSGWGIAFWFAELFVAGGLVGYGFYRQESRHDGVVYLLLGAALGVAFVGYGPELMIFL